MKQQQQLLSEIDTTGGRCLAPPSPNIDTRAGKRAAGATRTALCSSGRQVGRRAGVSERADRHQSRAQQHFPDRRARSCTQACTPTPPASRHAYMNCDAARNARQCRSMACNRNRRAARLRGLSGSQTLLAADHSGPHANHSCSHLCGGVRWDAVCSADVRLMTFAVRFLRKLSCLLSCCCDRSPSAV
jgi:hypothetical protein